MPNEYIKISERENIQDENIARILDYIERVSNVSFCMFDDIKFCYLGKIEFQINSDEVTVYNGSDHILTMPTQLFADNIVGLFGGIKNLGKI